MQKTLNAKWGWLALASLVCATCVLADTPKDKASGRPQLAPGETNWVEPELKDGKLASIVTTDQTQGATPASMVAALFGGVAPPGIAGIVYTGNPRAGGTFIGGTAQGGGCLSCPIGFPSGMVLSSGMIRSVMPGGAAANWRDWTSTNWGLGGDFHLNNVTAPPAVTFDAASLEFDWTPPVNKMVGFAYVFGSEEYNEWVWSRFNDRAAIFYKVGAGPPIGGGFFLDNLARVWFGNRWWPVWPPPGIRPALPPPFWPPPRFWVPVTINTVNKGNPFPGPP